MNDVLQNIAVYLTFLGALGFLIKKFFWKPAKISKKGTKACDTDGCGCH